MMRFKHWEKPSSIEVGDTVMVRNQHPKGKFSLPFEPEPWIVQSVHGTKITAMRHGVSIS